MDNIEASVINHDTLTYSMGFVAEMAILIDGPDGARKRIKELIANGFIHMEEVLDELPDVPATQEDRYQRALDLVNVLGRAVGNELNELSHKGDREHLYRVFYEGMLSDYKRKVIGSSIERVVFDCGRGAGQILFSVSELERKEVIDTIMQDARIIFEEGVEA